jgi:hypothetical protein
MKRIEVSRVNEKPRGLNIKHITPIWKRRCDLKGQILKAGWIYSRPYIYFEGQFSDPRGSHGVYIDGNYPNLTGMFYDIAQSLAHHCNFTMELQEVKEFGVRHNDGTWTGIIEMLRKRELDIGIVDITPTKERSTVADFSIGLRSSDFILLQATSKHSFNWKIYKNVFSDIFWICLCLSIFSLTTCLFLIQFCTMGKYTSIDI